MRGARVTRGGAAVRALRAVVLIVPGLALAVHLAAALVGGAATAVGALVRVLSDLDRRP